MIKVEADFLDFSSNFKSDQTNDFSIETAESIRRIIDRIEKEYQKLPDYYISLLQHIRSTVIDMPIRYISNVNQKRLELFTVYHKQMPLHNSDFKSIINEGRKKIPGINQTYYDLEKNETFFILISHRVFEELKEMRFWIKDVITKQWALQCSKYSPSDINSKLLLESLEGIPYSRNSLEFYRKTYIGLKLNNCFYTDKKINENQFVIDHFLPWSRFPSDFFWNLFPTSADLNSKKSDKLIVLNEYIRNTAIHKHLEACIGANIPRINDELKITYIKYLGGNYKQDINENIRDIRNLILYLYNDLDKSIISEKICV